MHAAGRQVFAVHDNGTGDRWQRRVSLATGSTWPVRPGEAQAITATAKTISVTDASRFKVGQYVVIYDGPAGSFRNAEHAKVSGINVTSHTITLSALPTSR